MSWSVHLDRIRSPGCSRSPPRHSNRTLRSAVRSCFSSSCHRPRRHGYLRQACRPVSRRTGQATALAQPEQRLAARLSPEKDAKLSTSLRPFYTHSNPQPLEPGNVVELEVEILPFSNVFKKGHRLRLEISNSDLPITDGLFTHQYSWFNVGRDTIHHDAQYASRLVIPVVSGA